MNLNTITFSILKPQKKQIQEGKLTVFIKRKTLFL